MGALSESDAPSAEIGKAVTTAPINNDISNIQITVFFMMVDFLSLSAYFTPQLYHKKIAAVNGVFDVKHDFFAKDLYSLFISISSFQTVLNDYITKHTKMKNQK